MPQLYPNLDYPNVVVADDDIVYEGGVDGFKASLAYRIRGHTDRIPAYADAVNATFHFLGGDPANQVPPVFRTRIELFEVNRDEGLWTAVVDYQSFCSSADEQVSVATGIATATVFKSFQTIQALAFDGSAITTDAFGGLMNVDSEGKVKGVEVPIPDPKFTITKCYPAGWLSDCANWYDIIGLSKKTNSAAWRCFGIREVMFEGLSGNGVRIDPANPPADFPELSFGSDIATLEFSFQPTVMIPFGEDDQGDPQFLTKRGFENFWSFNEKVVIPGPPKIETVKPKYGFVELSILEADFNAVLFP